MKKLTLLALAIVLIFACNKKDNNEFVPKVYPKTGTYYQTDTGQSLIVADPIIYDVIVKNPSPDDEWTEFCLENTDVDAIMNVIFNAVYQGKLTPYHYFTDSVIPKDYVKLLEIETDSMKVGKIQFEEDWYFDENNLKFYKKVKSLIFGYELINNNGVVYGYKPGFKIYFDKEHNKH